MLDITMTLKIEGLGTFETCSETGAPGWTRTSPNRDRDLDRMDYMRQNHGLYPLRGVYAYDHNDRDEPPLSTWMSCDDDIGHLLNYTQKGDRSHYVCRLFLVVRHKSSSHPV